MRSLFAKLALVLLALFTLLGIAQILLTITSTRLYQQEVSQKLNRELAANIAAERPILRNGEIDPEALEALFGDLMVVNPAIELYLLDAEGRIVAFSAPAGKIVRPSVSLAPVHRFLSGAGMLPIRGDDPRSEGGRKVFSAARIGPPGAEPVRYLYIILAGEEYDSAAALFEGSHVLRLSAAAAGAAVLFALLAALAVFAMLTRRLRRLTRRVNHFQGSGFAEPAPVTEARPDGDEVDRLSAAFDDMAGRIVQQVEALRRTDEERRELIANISH
ncbi:MAG: sensor histidine kinase, partial [Thermoanaerobaculia bacterium]